MKKKDVEDCMELCPHQCVEMERYCVNVTWKNSFVKMFFGHLQFHKLVLVPLIILRVSSIIQLSLPGSHQARSWPDLKSWLSPVSYCMLHFLAAFPNGFHLSVQLVLSVDHCKCLSRMWETGTQMNHGLIYLQRFSPAASPAQQGIGEASPSWSRLKWEAEWAACGDAWFEKRGVVSSTC